MNVVIIDNESKFRETLKNLLDLYCPTVQVMGEAHGVDSGVALIEKLQPQLVFLDIQMDDGTGLDLLNAMPDRSFEVIFITAYDEFALDAIKLSALDYLLKPIDPDELISAIDKAKASLSRQENQLHYAQLKALLQNVGSDGNNKKKIVLKDVENVYLVEISEIIRCEAAGSYTQFHLTETRKIMVSKNLREYENTLKPYGFYRSHHSHLFNIHQLDRYDKSLGGSLVMKDGSQIPVSVRRKEPLLRLLTEFYG